MSKRKKSDDDAPPPGPAGATSSYIFFCKDFRQQNKYKNLSVTEAGAQQGKEWRELSASKKGKYERKAEVDRQRYQKELEKYKSKYGCATPPKRVKKPVKPVRDPDLPRSATSSYMFFCKDFRKSKKNAGLSVTEAGSVQGKEWRELSASKKAKYEAMAAKDRKRYNREMEIYKRNHPEPEPEKKETKPAKKKKDPNAPKRPTSSYMFFNRCVAAGVSGRGGQWRDVLRRQQPEKLPSFPPPHTREREGGGGGLAAQATEYGISTDCRASCACGGLYVCL